MNLNRHQATGMKFVLLIALAFAMCMPICDLADHHGSSAVHPSLCTTDIPQVFQLLILMSALFLANLAGIVIPPAPIFSLLKPPRFVPPYPTAR